jgi:PAS domain S-box-containing protein
MKISKARKSNDPPDRGKAVLTKSDRYHPTINASKFTRTELEQLAEASNDAVRVINRDFTIRYINHAFAEMTGVNQDNVIGKKCWEVFPSSLCHTPNCRTILALNGEQKIKVEIERQKQDGTIIPCEVTTAPLKDSDGNINGVIEQFRDITEIRHKEDEIKESEARYKALIELGTEAGEAIVMLQDVKEKEGIQIFVNDQWAQLTGYTKEELVGMSFFDLIGYGYKDLFLQRHRKVIEGNNNLGAFDIYIVRKNMTRFPIELVSTLANFSGQLVEIAFLRDITERMNLSKKIAESEQKYRSLFENAPVAIWEMNYSGAKKLFDVLKTQGVKSFSNYFDNNPRFLLECAEALYCIDFNQSLLDLYEFPSREHFLSNFRQLFLKGIEYSDFHKYLMIALAEGQTKFGYDEHVLTFKGNRRIHHIELRVAPGEEQTLSRAFLSVFDITDRVKAQEDLKSYQAHLEDMVNERTSQLNIEIQQRQQAENKLRSLYEMEQHTHGELERQYSNGLNSPEHWYMK